jgi:hypothetical protein
MTISALETPAKHRPSALGTRPLEVWSVDGAASKQVVSDYVGVQDCMRPDYGDRGCGSKAIDLPCDAQARAAAVMCVLRVASRYHNYQLSPVRVRLPDTSKRARVTGGARDQGHHSNRLSNSRCIHSQAASQRTKRHPPRAWDLAASDSDYVLAATAAELPPSNT